MKKILICLLALFLLMPVGFAAITDEPNSISCQIDEVELSPDMGSATVVREDISTIDLDKYWHIWCYVQDAQNSAVSNAQVLLEIDEGQIGGGTTVGGWIRLPVVYSNVPVAYYSTATPGEGLHQIKASAGNLEYNANLTVGAGGSTPTDGLIDERFIYLGIGVAVIIIAFLGYNLVIGKKR